MPEPIQKTLNVLGLTLGQVIGLFLALGFYFGEAKPRLDSLPALTCAVKEVGVSLADLRSDVKVHEVLLLGLQEVKEQQLQLRKEVSTIEGKLSHVKEYGGSQ